MDILQRAADLLDRAQRGMADASNPGARAMVSTAQVRALEGRQADLRRRIEAAALELGKLAFRRWKNGGHSDEPAMVSLCEQLDRLNGEYQYVVGQLMDARTGMMPYASPQAPPQDLPPYPPTYGPGYPQTPRPYTQPPSLPSYTPDYAPPPLPTYQDTAPIPSSWAPPPVAPAPFRPSRPVRECPECLTLVPGNADFCPTCGMRI